MSRAISARLRNRNRYSAIGVTTAIVLIAGCGSNGDNGNDIAVVGGTTSVTGVGGAGGHGTGGRPGTTGGVKATGGRSGPTGGQVNSTCPVGSRGCACEASIICGYIGNLQLTCEMPSVATQR